MNIFFQNYATIILFLHVISAVVWVGGMIAVRVTVHPAMKTIEEPKVKLGKTLEITGRLFNLVIPFIATLLITATLFIVSGFKTPLIYAKELIWAVMTLNFIYMYYKRKEAQELFNSDNLAEAKASVKFLPTLLLPINITLGVVAIMLGVVLRGI